MAAKFELSTVPLHETASGARYEIDVWQYRHRKTNQRIYLQGGLHGVELTGTAMLYEFMQEVEKRQPHKTIICVPMANPMGLDSQIMGQQVGYNNLHTNQQNCWNWNRIGNLREEPSIEGRWIKTLLDLSADCSTVLDFHTAGQEMAPHLYCNMNQLDPSFRLGIPHLLAWSAPSNSFCDTCYTRGQFALTFELSASRTVPREGIEMGLRALRIFLGFEDEAKPHSRLWQVESHLVKWLIPESGVLSWLVPAGKEVTEGEPLAKLYRRDGIRTLESPYTGLLLLKNPIHAPHQHQEIAKFLLTKMPAKSATSKPSASKPAPEEE